MKIKSNNAPLWNRLKLPVIILAALAFAGLGTPAQAQITYTPVFTNVWVVPASTYPTLPADQNSNVRGIAISPLTTNVLYSGTTGGTNGTVNHVSTISFESGSNYLAQLSSTNVGGGIVTLMNVRVSDDGSVYACNRRDGGVNNFTIYRWPSETDTAANPVKIVDAPFTMRLGDHMDVRGGGINTEIVVVGSSGSGANVSTNFVIFRPIDATLTSFTNFSIPIPGNSASAIVSTHGVTFEGTNNVVWVRDAGTGGRRIVYNPATYTATCNRTNTFEDTTTRGLKYYTDTNGVELLACLRFNGTSNTAQQARVYRIPTTPTGALVSVLSSNFPVNPGTNVYWPSRNGNGLANIDAKNGYFVFGAPGYGITFFRVGFVTTAPPSGSTVAISASTVVETYPVTLTANASGSLPLTYQFYFTNSTTTNLLVSSTNNIFAIASVSATNVGSYYVIVTNLYGKATSSVVRLLTVLPKGFSNLATQTWTLAPGSQPYLTGSGDTQRGIGYDPINQRLVLVSRAPTNGVHLLNAATGADEGEMDIAFMLGLTPIPGIFPLNMCGVADDGAVYAANLLASDAGGPDYFAIYRWAGATTSDVMTGAYGGNPLSGQGLLGRIGDTMAVRGAGTSTEIICTFRNTNCVAIFTTGDGLNFNFNLVTVTNLPIFAGGSAAGLGVSWGVGNTFWVKTSGGNLRQVSYDLGTGIGEVIASNLLPDPEAALAVDNGNAYAAIIGFGVSPRNLAIYDISNPTGVTLNSLVDRELFATSNPNVNGTGSVAIDGAGGRVFALDSNNGIMAASYAGRLSIAQDGADKIITWPTSASILQATTNLALPFADVPAATSPHTNTTDDVKFFRLRK